MVSLRRLLSLVALVALTAALGCGGSAKHGGSGESPPVVVSVAKVIEAPVQDYEDFTGRTAAVDAVTLKARATGYLDDVLFKDGELVKKGQLLYKIDDRTYAAQVKDAEATIKRSEAELEKANADLTRARQMSLGSAISRQEYDKLTAQKQELAATTAAAKAKLESAQLYLDFCKVTAPIEGVISRTQITKGNLVAQDQTTLTSIVSIDPIYAYFDVDERTVLRIRDLMREFVRPEGIEKADEYMVKHKVDEKKREQVRKLLAGRVTPAVRKQIDEIIHGHDIHPDEPEWLARRVLEKYPKFENYKDRKIPLGLATQIEKGYPHEGFIDFVDNQLNASTGTLRVRGQFPNAGKPPVLTPNMFVRIRLGIGEPQKALLVTDAAIVTQQDRKFVLVVNDKDEVEMRPITPGPLRGSLRVITGDIKAGERVIVRGLQRVQPDSKVKAELIAMPDADTSKK